MKLSDLRSAADIHEQDMRDPEYKREYDRLKLANDVAVRVLAYRTEHGMSQTDLARKLGMRQPNIARLESGEHEPTLSTLARLSSVLGLDFSVDITPAGACLAALRAAPPARRRKGAILDPEKAAARQQILFHIARAEGVLRDILGRPHYKIRGGQVVTDPATGEPVPDRKPEREARALLADMDRLRSRLTGLPLGQDTGATTR